MSSFPQPFTSTTSHWQGTNRGPTSLFGHEPGALPASADIVIVGGGTMGASLAYFLTRKGAEGEGKRVVLLEAKDVASGASGRNGGHLGPATSQSFMRLQRPLPYGADLPESEAAHVIQAERDNLDLICGIIERERLDVDLWRGMLCEVHATRDEAETAAKDYEGWLAARRKHGFTSSHDTRMVTDKREAEKISRFNKVAGVQLRPAGSVHSHKLCTELMKTAMASRVCDFQLHTWTPVSDLAKSGSHWSVKTSRGTIKAPRVILCTNAHTKTFFPEADPLHSHIQPRFAQCAVITPPPTYSGARALEHTYNMEPEWYLVQTPTGQIVLGGGREELQRMGKMPDLTNEDDSFVVDEWTKEIAAYCPREFAGWGKEGWGEGLTGVWSGILTAVKDFLPVVGEVPHKEGLWVAAGFHGHGQSRIFSVASGLSHQLKTGTWDPALPRSFELTQQRLDKVARLEKKLAEQGQDWFAPDATEHKPLGSRVQAVKGEQPVMTRTEKRQDWGFSCAIA